MTLPDETTDQMICRELARRGLSEIAAVGSGGMGAVYRGFDETLSRWVAVKITDPVVARNPENRRRFQAEMRLLGRIRHPSVVNIHSGHISDDLAYFFMDFIPGGNLDDLIRQRSAIRRPFALDEVVHYLRPIADALDYLHAMHPPVIHRDIKPANILIPGDPANGSAAVLTDFGISLAGGDTRVTSLGMVVGSEQYLAPERFLGDRDDMVDSGASSDNYALALVAWEMLTLASLYDTMPSQIWRRGLRPTTLDAGWLRPELRPWTHQLNNLFQVYLADSPAARPRSAMDVVEGLDQLSHRIVSPVTPRQDRPVAAKPQSYGWTVTARPLPGSDPRPSVVHRSPVSSGGRKAALAFSLTAVIAALTALVVVLVSVDRADADTSWSDDEDTLRASLPDIVPAFPGDVGGAGLICDPGTVGPGQRAQIVCGHSEDLQLTLTMFDTPTGRDNILAGPDGSNSSDVTGSPLDGQQCAVTVYRASAGDSQPVWVVHPENESVSVTVSGAHAEDRYGSVHYCR